ncbi:uncharacterized protein [Maniola hyperantus]|uniref:uncharacterized protein n=1 Tax=Aphantopus hyperantus TaxID=2795564 RepID=UPI0015691CD0|nr:uncharacterized protein LOC117992699 [Maniola hyperantus]
MSLKELIIKRSSVKGRVTKFKNYISKINKLSVLDSLELGELKLKLGHFLIGRPLTALPSPNVEDFSSNSLDRYSRLEKVRQQFWRRWQRDYISELQQRTKWRTNRGKLNVGDLVLLQEDNIAPLNWRLGRVTALFPGTDGISRVADIRTARGVVRRALTSICPLFSPDELVSS